jgi:regulator of sigma E protease
MTYIISFIIVLGVLVLIHEIGHFIAARRVGVRVERFSIGFGPEIAAKVVGDTRYRLAVFPLGGYVKLAGEDETPDRPPKPDELPAKRPWEKIQIFAAGSVANIILAFILMPVVFMIGIEVPSFFESKPVIGWVESGSPAELAGLKTGDMGVSLNGREMPVWRDVITEIILNPGRELKVKALRNEAVFECGLFVTASKSDGGGYAGIGYSSPAVLGSVKAGWPADLAGLKEDDRIIAVDGVPVSFWHEMASVIRIKAGLETVIEARRGSTPLVVKIIPRRDEASGAGQIGITAKNELVLKRYGFFEAIFTGWKETISLFDKTFVILWKLVSAQLSFKSLGGPIMIAQQAGSAAKTGATSLIYMMAFLSLQLGVINLLPIPVLDGGAILFLLIEMVTRRTISDRVKEITQKVGIALLATLMLAVTVNDVLRSWDGFLKYISSIASIFL